MDGEIVTLLIKSRAWKRSGPLKYLRNVRFVEMNVCRSMNIQECNDLMKVHQTSITYIIETVLVVTIPRNLHGNKECVEVKEKEL